MSQELQSTNINLTQNKSKKSIDLYLPPNLTSKKTLVLDLDETLVHSQFGPFEIPSDVVINIEIENELHDIHVLIRPGVKEFLEKMSQIYEIVIFTASISKYAGPLLDILDKDKFCSYRLFREHCTLINTSFAKDLKKLGRNLKDVIIVDNSPMAYLLNTENGIPILTWFDNKNDKELYKISPLLEFLSQVNDVREYIPKIVINNEISYKNAMMVMDEYERNIDRYKQRRIKQIEDKDKDNLVDKNYENKEIDDNNFKKINQDKNQQQININIINNNITNYIYDNNLPVKNENISNNIMNKDIENKNKNEKNKFNPNSIIASVNRAENPDIKNSLNENNKKVSDNYIHKKSESTGFRYKIKDKKYNLADMFNNNINKNPKRNNTNYNSKSYKRKEIKIKQNINNMESNKNNKSTKFLSHNNKNISVNKKAFNKKTKTNNNNIELYKDGNLTTVHKSQKIILNFSNMEKEYKNYNKKNKKNVMNNLLHSVDFDKNDIGILHHNNNFNLLNQGNKNLYNDILATKGNNRNKFLKNNKINNKKSSSIDNEINKNILEKNYNFNNFQKPSKNINNIKLNNDFNYPKKNFNDKKLLLNYTLDEKPKLIQNNQKKEKISTLNNYELLKEKTKNNSAININSYNYDLSKSTQINQRSESMKELIANKEIEKSKKIIKSVKQRPKSSAIFKNNKYNNKKKQNKRYSSGRNPKKNNVMKYEIIQILERRGIAKSNRLKHN
jgi:Dullard-like phosphatase family protein